MFVRSQSDGVLCLEYTRVSQTLLANRLVWTFVYAGHATEVYSSCGRMQLTKDNTILEP